MREKNRSLPMTTVYQIVLPALVIAFTFCVFGPLEIVMTSRSQFWFTIKDIAPTIGVAFGSIFLLSMLIGYVCVYLVKWPIVGRIWEALSYGSGIALYIQGNYTFVDYGVMDGSPIDWDNFGIWPTVDTLIGKHRLS